MSTSWMWKEDLKKQQLTALPPKRENFPNTKQGAKNYSIASSQAKNMASHLESRGLTGNNERSKVNSSGGGLSWLTGLFSQSQNKTAEQSGDTTPVPQLQLGGMSPEAQAKLAGNLGVVKGFIDMIQALKPKQEPTKGSSPGDGALQGVTDEGYIEKRY